MRVKMIFVIEIPEMLENLSGIYKIENNIDNRLYIGRAKNLRKRAEQHKRNYENCRCNQKINKFIRENPNAIFKFSVISFTNSIVEQEEKEIKKHNSVVNGFNMIYNDDEFLEKKWEKRKRKKKNKEIPLTRIEELTKILFGKKALEYLKTSNRKYKMK